jgi:hypothetical protein
MVFRFTQRSGRASLMKRARRMFRADRNHIHHVLLGLGASRRRIVIGLYSVAVAFCAMALLAASSRTINLGLLLVALEIVVVFTMRKLGMRARALKISFEKRREAKELLNDSLAVGTQRIIQGSPEGLPQIGPVRNA